MGEAGNVGLSRRENTRPLTAAAGRVMTWRRWQQVDVEQTWFGAECGKQEASVSAQANGDSVIICV